jgi:adenylate cyclase
VVATERAHRAAELAKRVGTRPDLLPVRIGVHTGPAVRRGGDCYGSAVNVAARLADQAKPNETLVSEATWATVRCEFTKPVDTPRCADSTAASPPGGSH